MQKAMTNGERLLVCRVKAETSSFMSSVEQLRALKKASMFPIEWWEYLDWGAWSIMVY